MQGTITITGGREYGVHVEASLICEDILDKSYLRDIIDKLMNDNNKKEDKENG